MLQIEPIRVFRYAPLALLLIGIAFLFTRSNLSGIDRSYIFSDTVTYEYPMQRYFHDRLMKGQLPLWNPYASSGNPVIGTLQARLLYPPHLILATLFGLQWGQFLEIIFHFFLGMFGSYAMLRSYRFTYAAAFSGTLIFTLSAEFLGTFKLLNLLACLAWLPVCIFAIRTFTRNPNPTNAMGMTIAFTMLLYAGYPQYAFFAANACTLIFVFSAIHNRRTLLRRKFHTVVLLLAAITLFGILAAPQLISAAEFFRLGLRGEIGVTLDQFNRIGGRSFSSIFPDLLGGSSSTKYVIPAMILMGFATSLLYSRYRAIAISMLCLGIPTALLCMGAQGPVADWYFNHYPLGSAFRIPERSIHILLVPCSIGIALFVQNGSRLLRSIQLFRTSAAFRTLIIVLALILLVLPQKLLIANALLHVAKYIDGYGRSVAQTIPAQNAYRFDSTCNAFFAPCDKAGMLAMRRSLSDYEPSNTYRSFLFSSLLSEEIRNPTKGSIWLGETHLDYKSLSDARVIRLLRASSVKWIIGNRGLWLRANKRTQETVAARLKMHPGIISAPEVLDFVSKTLGPAALMTMGEHLDQYTLFEMIEPTLPRAYLSNRIVPTSDARDSVAKLSEGLNPSAQTVIELAPARAKLSNPVASDHLTPATFLIDDPEQVALETRSTGDTFLVLNDKFFPDWECRIDGQIVEIFPANIVFRAVRMPAGTHRAVFQYKPRMFLVTAWISGIAWLLVISLAIVVLIRRLKTFFKKGLLE